MKIMFVCTGNICRSPLAEAVFRDLAAEVGVADRFHLASSGTTAYHVGQSADGRMRAVARAHGLRFNHRSRRLSRKDLEEYDLVLAMDQSNMREIAYLTSEEDLLDKVRLFREFDPEGGKGAEVPDPYYDDHAGFEEVFTIVHRTSHGLLSHLLGRVESRGS